MFNSSHSVCKSVCLVMDSMNCEKCCLLLSHVIMWELNKYNLTILRRKAGDASKLSSARIFPCGSIAAEEKVLLQRLVLQHSTLTCHLLKRSTKLSSSNIAWRRSSSSSQTLSDSETESLFTFFPFRHCVYVPMEFEVQNY